MVSSQKTLILIALGVMLMVQLCLAGPTSHKQKMWRERGYKKSDRDSPSTAVTDSTSAATTTTTVSATSVLGASTPSADGDAQPSTEQQRKPLATVSSESQSSDDESTNVRETRDLGTLNPWQYTDFTVPSMTFNERRMANALLTYISANRHGAGFIYEHSSRSFLNTVTPVVDLAKYLADLLLVYRNNDTDFLAQVAIGHNFTCDLDWAQPDPASDFGNIFSMNDDWCATDVDILWAEGDDASQVQEELDYYYLMSIGDHGKKQIAAACSLNPPTNFKCVVILARLQQTLTQECRLCCDPYACAKKR